jgi:hypothetical protein
MGIVLSQSKRSSRIDKGAVCGPQAHDDRHRSATGRAAGDARCRVCETSRRTIDALGLHDHQAEGVGRDGTACLHTAAVPDFHAAIGEDRWEESAEKLDGVEGGGA